MNETRYSCAMLLQEITDSGIPTVMRTRPCGPTLRWEMWLTPSICRTLCASSTVVSNTTSACWSNEGEASSNSPRSSLPSWTCELLAQKLVSFPSSATSKRTNTELDIVRPFQVQGLPASTGLIMYPCSTGKDPSGNNAALCSCAQIPHEFQRSKRKVGLRESIGHFSPNAHDAAAVWPMTADALGRIFEIFKKLEHPVRLQHSSENLTEDLEGLGRYQQIDS